MIVLSSSSRGNGYLLDCGKEQLIIECGVPFNECAKALKHDISKVQAVICTHSHQDHAKYISQYKAHGLRVYCTPEYAPQADCYYMMFGLRYVFGKFKVMPVEVPHGDCQCYSYIVSHPDFGLLLFATDLSAFPYNIKCLNHIFLECNYGKAIRTNAILDGADVRSSSNTHMELNTCISVIKRLKSPDLQTVVLLHLSDGLSDAEGFKRAIYEQCRIKCEIAEKNAVFYLEKSDF